jgi:D-alanyl-D-alanine carboxypeptidase
MPRDYMPTDLVLFPREYSYYRQPAWLRQEVADAGLRLIRDAEREGLTLRVFSAYRDYSHQSRLKKGGGVVASAGASQHQYGTTMDVTRDEKTLMKKSFAGTPEGQWLRKNAYKYGFRATVVRDRGSGEEVIEPWHLRYFGPGNAGGPDTRPIAGTTMVASKAKSSGSSSKTRQTAATGATPAPAPQPTPQPSRFSLKRLLPGNKPQ